ncbi:MAG TPA: DUF4384 domain-containing protein [Blastocatellia bacterium]|nr:DUF4384 domain-containing protein [Blastocatellia bacterium]
MSRGRVILMACSLAFSQSLFLTTPLAQQGDVTRGIVPDYLKKRPASRKKAVVPKPVKADPTSGQPSPIQESAGEPMVGITIWRVRLATARDGGEAVRFLRPRKRDGRPANHILERIDEGQPVPAGASIRFGMEISEPGYLYIVDQEEYAGKGPGPPMLIFPNIHSRNNAVTPGRLIEIPTDPEVDFEVEVKPGQTGEVLTLLVSPEPVDLAIGPDEMTPLSEETFANWKGKWGVKVERIKVGNSAGRPYTKTEKAAASDRDRPLTQGDPLPHTIYKVAARPGDPIMLSLRLNYQESGIMPKSDKSRNSSPPRTKIP